MQPAEKFACGTFTQVLYDESHQLSNCYSAYFNHVTVETAESAVACFCDPMCSALTMQVVDI